MRLANCRRFLCFAAATMSSACPVLAACSQRGIRGKVIGGGRIEYCPARQPPTVSIYGYSKTFGRSEGCNKLSASLVSAAMPAAKVSWSDDGY